MAKRRHFSSSRYYKLPIVCKSIVNFFSWLNIRWIRRLKSPLLQSASQNLLCDFLSEIYSILNIRRKRTPTKMLRFLEFPTKFNKMIKKDHVSRDHSKRECLIFESIIDSVIEKNFSMKIGNTSEEKRYLQLSTLYVM